jgi:predicted Mrr-cat superfamily restriction endonuclease
MQTQKYSVNQQVKPKKDPILELLQNYKTYISKTKMQDEVYKWELVKNYKGRPDINAEDFTQELKSIKFQNLLYAMSIAVTNHLAKDKPEEYRKLFISLFDESSPLNDRVKNFNVDSLKLYRSLGETLGHHQDERAIATYLTLHNPLKYTFYKSTFYKEFCKLMGVAPAGKNEKYAHYLELVNQFIENYIVPDTELTDTVKNYIPEYYDGKNNLLLAQDILYTMFNKAEENSSYWVFQGNPKVYDFNAAIKKGLIDQWSATAHRDKMKPGDKVIFWLTGENAGCYALGEITSEAYENKEEQDEFWKQEDKTEWKIGVKVTHDLSTNPILKEMLEDTNELKDLNVGHQGTNFSATEEQFESFLDLVNSRTLGAYGKIKKALDADKLELFISLLKKFTQDNNLNENDTRISFNIRASRLRLVFVIGSRYSLCIEKKNKETILSFISQLDITKTTETPFKNNKGEVEAYWNQFNFNQQEEFERYVFDGLNAELQRNHHCNYKKYSNPEFSGEILGKSQIKYWLYAPGENANMWDEFLQEGTMGLGWDNLGDLNEYATKGDIATRLKELSDNDTSKANDATANFDFKESISIGDVIIAKKGRNAYLGYGFVTSDYYYDRAASSYRHRRKVNWVKYGKWETEHLVALKTLTDITNLPYKPNPTLLAYQAVLNIINGIHSEKTNHKPTNKILYGPPGTGKTFKLKDHYFPMYTTKESSLSAEQHFKNVVSECSWWQVIALALLELGDASKVADIMNNRWVIKKSELSDAKSIRPIMWSCLQSHTIQTSETVGVKQRQAPFIFNKKNESYWEILEMEVREQIPELYEMLESVNNFNPSSDKDIQRYVFTTFHQSYSYEDFIEGIKPVMIDGEVDGNVAYHIEDGVFKQLCKKAALDPENRYAIFIDEINRGNVSSIFGELITLIEQDKRKGATNAMSALLPYSKNPFSVPQNVDIYGTMNTADRSVEALDTALRRRFSFEEMLPKPELLKDKGENGSGKVGEIVLEELLITINERIEALVDRDHTIGHAFFMEVDSLESLRNVFANKVIPLLQEYFYGDYAKMEMVIGPDFFKSEKRKKKVTFAIQNEDIEIPIGNYELINILDPTFNFDSAINRLLNRKVIEVEGN